MKELESSQEIMLLKDAIISAASQGFDFQNKDQAKTCADIIKEAINDVDVILSMDCHDLDSKKQAHIAMHSLVFSQALLSSNDLDENEQKYYKHACQSLPEIGWPTYLYCVQSCDWTDFATESWVQMPTKMQSRIVPNRIMQTLKTIAVIPDFIDLSYFTVKINYDTLWNVVDAWDNRITSINSIIDMLAKLHETEIEQIAIPTSCVIATISLLAHCLKPLQRVIIYESDDNFDQLLTKMFHTLVSLTIKIINSAERATDPDLVYSLNDCYAIIQNTLIDYRCNLSLREFCDFVKNEVLTSLDQEGIAMDIISVNSRDWQSDDAIERLLVKLQVNANLPKAVECFRKNYKILKKRHVRHLLTITTNLPSSEAIKIQQIVHEAFMDWTLDDQDSFRGDWHEHYGFRDFIFAETKDFSSDLTKVINLLSTVRDDENVVAKEISFLCLQAPIFVIHRLIDFAIQSGQRKTVTEILHCLKSSVCFAHNHGPKILSFCIESTIPRLDLTSQALANLYLLIESLLDMDLLQSAELVLKVIMRNLNPSQFTGRFLKIFDVTLTHSTIQAIEEVKLPVVILRLCKLLHFCMTEKLTEIYWDILDLKQQVIVTLNIILDWMKVNPNLVREHEMCWLWLKLEDLDATVFPYMLNTFALYGLEHLCIKKVQQMSQPCLLLSKLLNSNNDGAISTECWRTYKGHAAVTATTVQLLPRLTSQEVQSLLQELCLCFENPSNDGSVASLVGITVLLNSFTILSKFCHSMLPERHLNTIVQACITSIKVTLLPHQPLSMRMLAMVTCLIGHMAADMDNKFGSAAKILLLDLLTQVQTENAEAYSSVVLRAVNRLGDENLAIQAAKIFKKRHSETGINGVKDEE